MGIYVLSFRNKHVQCEAESYMFHDYKLYNIILQPNENLPNLYGINYNKCLAIICEDYEFRLFF